jgi:hypothetical protein
VIVDLQPGKHVAPRRLAAQSPAANVKLAEDYAEALLSGFENGVKANPQALLGLPLNHLATAYMLCAMRSYMVLRGQDDVASELAVDWYYRFRAHNRSGDIAKILADAGETQYLYESLVIFSMDLDSTWLAARARGDRQAIAAAQKTAQEILQRLFGDATSQMVGQMGSAEALIRDVRGKGQPQPGARTTLRLSAPVPPPAVYAPAQSAGTSGPKGTLRRSISILIGAAEATEDPQNKKDLMASAARLSGYIIEESNWAADGQSRNKDSFAKFLQEENARLSVIGKRERNGRAASPIRDVMENNWKAGRESGILPR